MKHHVSAWVYKPGHRIPHPGLNRAQVRTQCVPLRVFTHCAWFDCESLRHGVSNTGSGGFPVLSPVVCCVPQFFGSHMVLQLLGVERRRLRGTVGPLSAAAHAHAHAAHAASTEALHGTDHTSDHTLHWVRSRAHAHEFTLQACPFARSWGVRLCTGSHEGGCRCVRDPSVRCAHVVPCWWFQARQFLHRRQFGVALMEAFSVILTASDLVPPL